MPFYLGKREEDDLILFHSAMPPTKQTHGHLYNAVIGPFESRVVSGYFARYGRNNPDIRTAAAKDAFVRIEDRIDAAIETATTFTSRLPLVVAKFDHRLLTATSLFGRNHWNRRALQLFVILLTPIDRQLDVLELAA